MAIHEPWFMNRNKQKPTLDESIIVFSLCATVMVVLFWKTVRIVFWISSSVAGSQFAVASEAES